MAWTDSTRFRGSGGAGRHFQGPAPGGGGGGRGAPPDAPTAPQSPAPPQGPRPRWTIPKFPKRNTGRDYIGYIGKQAYKGLRLRHGVYKYAIGFVIDDALRMYGPGSKPKPEIPALPERWSDALPPAACHNWAIWDDCPGGNCLAHYPHGRSIRTRTTVSGVNCGTSGHVTSPSNKLVVGYVIPAGTREVMDGPFVGSSQVRMVNVTRYSWPAPGVITPIEWLPAQEAVPFVPGRIYPLDDTDNPAPYAFPDTHDPLKVAQGVGSPMPAGVWRKVGNTPGRYASNGPKNGPRLDPRADPQAGPSIVVDSPGPPSVGPPHSFAPPTGPRDKDAKGPGPEAIRKALGNVTEGLDVLDAAYKALPPKCKLKREKAPYRFGNKQTGSRTIAPTPQRKAKAIIDCMAAGGVDAAFVGKFAKNLIEDHIEDKAIGAVAGAAARAKSRRGKPWGLRPGLESPLW